MKSQWGGISISPNFKLTKFKYMVNLTNAKLWVGDNPYLMKAIIKRIKELKIPETASNRNFPLQNALSIYFTYDGWYCGNSDRNKLFDLAKRPEIQLTDILPITNFDAITDNHYKFYKPSKQILNYELQRSSKTDTTATRGSAIRSYIDECQIATGQRYIGNNTRAIQIEPKIERILLSNSILRSDYY